MANTYMKKMLNITIKEMQIEITMRHHRNWNPCILLIGTKNSTAAMGNNIKFPQKKIKIKNKN